MDGVAQKAPVSSFGEKLRREREMRKITLEEMAEATKIGTRALRALEEEKFDQLPGGIFNKGFVRSYARYLGIDEEQAVADYLAATGETTAEGEISLIAEQVEAQRVRDRSLSDAPQFTGLMKVVLVLAMLSAAGYIGFRYYQSYQQQRARAEEQSYQQRQAELKAEQERKAKIEADRQAQLQLQQNAQQPADANATAGASGAAGATAPVTTPATTPTTTPAKTPTTTPATTTTPSAQKGSDVQPPVKQPISAPKATPTTGAKSTVPASAPVTVEVAATKLSWISVRADGQSVYQGMLNPDDPAKQSKTFQASERLMLIVGNAAGVSVEFNGKPVGSLGAEGQRRTVTFTPKGFEKQ